MTSIDFELNSEFAPWNFDEAVNISAYICDNFVDGLGLINSPISVYEAWTSEEKSKPE